MTTDDRFVEGGYIPRGVTGGALQRRLVSTQNGKIILDAQGRVVGRVVFEAVAGARQVRLDAEVARHLAEVHADWYRIDRPMDAGLRTLTRGIGAACLLLSAIIFAALAATTPW